MNNGNYGSRCMRDTNPRQKQEFMYLAQVLGGNPRQKRVLSLSQVFLSRDTNPRQKHIPKGMSLSRGKPLTVSDVCRRVGLRARPTTGGHVHPETKAKFSTT